MHGPAAFTVAATPATTLMHVLSTRHGELIADVKRPGVDRHAAIKNLLQLQWCEDDGVR